MDFKKKKRTCSVRVVISVIVALMFMSGTSICFAADKYDGDAACRSSHQQNILSDKYQHLVIHRDKKPLYSRVNSVLVKLSIMKGNARGVAVVNAKSPRKMDEASVVMTFVNKKTGKSRTYNGRMQKQCNRYSFIKDCRLSQKGVYYVRVKIHCYNDRKLVETITKVSSYYRYDKK